VIVPILGKDLSFRFEMTAAGFNVIPNVRCQESFARVPPEEQQLDAYDIFVVDFSRMAGDKYHIPFKPIL
jgi:hypothetical protein